MNADSFSLHSVVFAHLDESLLPGYYRGMVSTASCCEHLRIFALPGSGTGPQAPAGMVPVLCGQTPESCQDRIRSQGWLSAGAV